MNRKKERAENWTSEEKDILLFLIKDSGDIIENKKTDTNTNEKKSQEWNMILQKFTELSGNKRSVIQLKGQWRRMKMLAKKNIANYKKAMNSTGDSEKPPSPSHEDQEILDICQVDVTEDQNDYDSDGFNTILNNIPSTSSTKTQNYDTDTDPVQVLHDKESILKSNEELKNDNLFELQKKEMNLRILYREKELQQQSLRHKLETQALKLEVAIKKKQLISLM